MANEIDNLIEEHFKELPVVIQDVVLKSNWQAKIRAIVQKYKLHIDQGAAIENLVLLTMIGVYDPEDFTDQAHEYARVSEEQAVQISLDVEQEIFKEIRQKLISITESHDTIDEVERVTNELTKVDDDIEQAAQKQAPRADKVTIPSKGTAVRPPATTQPVTQAQPVAKPSVPQVKPKIVAIGAVVAKTAPHVKPRIVEVGTQSVSPQTPTPVAKTEKPQEPVLVKAPQPTVPQQPTTPAPASAPVLVKPTPQPTIQTKPVIPKHMDPIVAARLGAPVLSARNRLEMEMSESSLKAGEVAVDVPAAGESPSTKSYTKIDPYRESVV